MTHDTFITELNFTENKLDNRKLSQELLDKLKNLVNKGHEDQFEFFENLHIPIRNKLLIAALETKDPVFMLYLEYLKKEGWYNGKIDPLSGMVTPEGLLLPVGGGSGHKLALINYFYKYHKNLGITDHHVARPKFKEIGGVIISLGTIDTNAANTPADKKRIQSAFDYLLLSEDYVSGVRGEIMLGLPKITYIFNAEKIKFTKFNLSYAVRTFRYDS